MIAAQLIEPELAKTVLEFPKLRIPEFEVKISRLLAEQYTFSIIPIEGRENRLRMESGLIAALAREPVCEPSLTWLGRSSGWIEIRECGLWNRQHVRGIPLSDSELEFLAELIDQQVR